MAQWKEVCDVYESHCIDGLSYKLAMNITGNLFYSFTHIDADRATLIYQFSRHPVSFSLRAEWK